MLRILVIIFLGVVAVGLGGLVVQQIRANEDQRQLNYLSRYWTNKIDRDIGIGESREQVARWAHDQFPEKRGESHYDENGRRFVIYPNRVKVTAFPYPCSSYSIQVQIDLGPNDRVRRRTVSTVGACV